MNFLNESIFEFVVNFGLNKKSFCVVASLSIGRHTTGVGCIDSFVDLSVVQHTKSIVATELECCFVHVTTCQTSNTFSTIDSASKFHCAKTVVLEDLLTLVVRRKNVNVITINESTETKDYLRDRILTLRALPVLRQVHILELRAPSSSSPCFRLP